MDHHEGHHAAILPVPEGVPRPRWSVMIPTFNCARHLRQTLMSVLAQDPGIGAMQIEVVDDHSTQDDPLAVVKEMGRGRIGFFQQSQNVGITANFEACLRRSRGTLVHLLHGDDYVRDGFYRTMERAFDDHPEIGAAFCRHIFTDESDHWQSISPLEQPVSGILPNAVARLAAEQRIVTPSIVVRREVYEQLGGFDRRLKCSEDWEMWVRIAAHYLIWYEAQPLAVYRMHEASNTGRHLRTGMDVHYTRLAIDVFQAYLPSDSAEKVTDRARQTYALAALDTAYAMARQGDYSAMVAQIREALALHLSLRTCFRLLLLLMRTAGLRFQQHSAQ